MVPVFAACRSFDHPDPSNELIMENVSRLQEGIDASLRMGSIKNCRFAVEFRRDVFVKLFNSNCSHLYSEEDFPSELFPPEWSAVYDRLGDGCRIDFPVIMKPSLKWSRKCYNKLPDESLSSIGLDIFQKL